MAPKRAKYYSYGNDDHCAETRKYIEDAGIVLDVRDLEKDPMNEHELYRLVGNLDIAHFLNPLSDSYSKNNLDQEIPARQKVLEMMAEDHTLIRRPIIQSSRLLLIGCDKQKITDMLQIDENGEAIVVDNNRGNTRPTGRSNTGRGSRQSGSRSGSRRPPASAKA